MCGAKISYVSPVVTKMNSHIGAEVRLHIAPIPMIQDSSF